MKLKEYMRDRLWFYIIAAVSYGVILLFLTAYRISGQLVIFVSVFFLIFIVFEESCGYFRKKKFYDELVNDLALLDKKYLIHEMLEEPDFLDGRIAYEALCSANKSMCENVNVYKRQSEEFREFIELWVHEVKLPVASLQLMSHNNSSELGEKFLEQLRRIDGYTDQVLYYARSENVEKDYIIKETSLKRTVANAALKNREDIQLNGACIGTDGLDIKVMTDGKWLEYILGQFIANSIKYAASERELVMSVSAEETDEMVLLHFRDNGIGIPESDLSRIFDKSFTGRNGRSYAKSTGMGLYIVKSLCERLGHSISVKSEEGSYTEFTIGFPKNNYYKMID